MPTDVRRGGDKVPALTVSPTSVPDELDVIQWMISVLPAIRVGPRGVPDHPRTPPSSHAATALNTTWDTRKGSRSSASKAPAGRHRHAPVARELGRLVAVAALPT